MNVGTCHEPTNGGERDWDFCPLGKYCPVNATDDRYYLNEKIVIWELISNLPDALSKGGDESVADPR